MGEIHREVFWRGSKEGALVMLIKKIASKAKEGKLNEAEKVEHTLDLQKKGGGRKSAKKKTKKSNLTHGSVPLQ